MRAFIGFGQDLMQALIDGRANIGVMYTPEARPGLTVELLLEERLVMVSTREKAPTAPDRDYVYVDWAPEFYAQHALTVDWVTCSRCAASTKLPAAVTTKKVRASSVSIVLADD